MSYISDPSESGSEYGGSEPEQQKPPYKTTPPAAAATTTTNHPQTGSLRTNPVSRSAEHVHASGSPITVAQRRRAVCHPRGHHLAAPRLRPASSGAASEATATRAATASRVETPGPEGAIGVAVPWAPESVAQEGLVRLVWGAPGSKMAAGWS